MADTGVDIFVRAKADLAALEETKNKLAEVKTVAEQLAAAGAKFDPKKGSFVSTMASDAEKATEGLKFTRFELATIAQQLSSGNVSAQGLGRALSALSLPITAAALAVFALGKVITDITEQEARFAKEIKDASDKLSDQESRWIALAQSAKSFTDAARLGVQTIAEVTELANKAADAQRAAELGPDSLIKWTLEFLAKVGSFGAVTGPWTQQLRDQAEALRILAVTARAAGLAVELFAQEEASAIASLPPPDAIDALRQKIVQLSAQRAVIDPTKTGQDYANYMNLTAAISSATNAIGDQIKKQQSQQDLLKQTQDQIRLNNAAGNEELVIQEKVAQAYDQKLRVLKEAGIPEEQAKQAAQSYAESVRQAAEVRAGAGADVSIQERLTELMRQQATILQGIRQQQELINQNPLLGIDAKNSALMQTYVQEMQQLQQVITALNTQKQSGLLDPAQLALVDQRLQQANFQLQLLQLKMVGLQRPLSTELINWANSFGSTWQQVGQSIQQSVNTSLQSLNQLLLTGKFNAQQLYQQLGNIALQLLEHIAIQQIMAAIGRASRAENVAAGPVTAAAWAPAAAATSVGSFGTSAVVGEAAALAAIFAIMGALVAHEGGAIGGRRLRRMHDGGLASDEHLIIAQDDEVMIQRSVARQPGMTEFLLGLNAGRFHEGGHIGGPPLTYGPGSPDATASDLNQFWGSYDNRLHWGDIAVAPGSGITPGKNSFIEIGGHWYHVADYSYYSPNHPTPPGTWEIYYPRGGGRESGNTRWDRIFGGKTTGGRPGYRGPGDPPARLLGFGKGGRNSRMGFPGFNARRGGFDMGGIGGDRPGFVDYTGSVPGGYDPYMSGHEWGSYDPITGRVTVGYTPGGYSGSGGIPPGGYTSSGGSGPELPWQGGSAFGTHSGAPSGYDAHGNPVYGGQMGGFNIPGGIGLPGLGRGSGGDIPFFSRMALNRFRSGGDPSFGFGPGSALYDFAAARHGRGGWSRRFAGRPTVNFGGVGQFERGNATRFGPNARAMSRVHGGGLIGNMRIPRLHGGGGIGGASSANLRSGEVNIHNYTDLKTLVKEMATRKGRNIIVDTVRGSRIDLGMR